MGGLAVGEVQAWDALTPSSGQAFRGGWTVGRRRNIARSKLEYLYMDLGSTQLFDVVPGVAETVSFKVNLARAGINTEGPKNIRHEINKNTLRSPTRQLR